MRNSVHSLRKTCAKLARIVWVFSVHNVASFLAVQNSAGFTTTNTPCTHTITHSVEALLQSVTGQLIHAFHRHYKDTNTHKLIHISNKVRGELI